MKKYILYVAIICFMIGAVFFAGLFLRGFFHTQQEAAVIEELSEIAFHPTETTVESTVAEIKPIEETKETEPEETMPEKERQALLDGYDYNALAEINSDCIGWITVDGTTISRPVMWRENDNSYYLDKDFYGNYAFHGTPFIDGFCIPGQGNLIIYGHNTADYEGFGTLMNYTSYEFYKLHPNINFYTQEGKCVYEIFAVCKISAQYDKEYYEYYGLEDTEKLQSFLNAACERSLYQTNINPSASDKIIMLSTCEYSQVNGRMVILAREIV